MIDNSRLENSLIHVARRYAPALIPPGWQKPGDYPGALPDLAHSLAAYNVLLMLADAPQASVKAWTDGYQAFYQAMCSVLFPSYMRVAAFYVDQQEPLIVALYGEATPVIVAMAGFVAPYVVARQGTHPLDLEILGMMDMILDEIEATDLPREDYRRLRDSGAAILRQLLNEGVRQLPLTPSARPIFDQMAAERATDEVLRAVPPPPPEDLPEPPPLPPDLPEYLPPPSITAPTSAPEAQPARRRFDPDAVPIFFNPNNPNANPQRGTNVPPPPVPPLPPRDPQRP